MEVVEQVLQRPAHRRVSRSSDAPGVVGLDARDDLSSGMDRLPAGGGEDDEFGAAIGWVWVAFEEALSFELVDEFGHRWSRHARPGGEVGESGSVGFDVAEHVQMGHPQLDAGLLGDLFGFGQELFAEYPQVMAEQLPNRQPGIFS